MTTSPALMLAPADVPLPSAFMRLFAGRQANSDSTQAYHVETMETALTQTRRALFESLARQWLEDTKWVSSMSKIANHNSLQGILDMGPPAIPFLLERLKRCDFHIHWFIALTRLVGENKAAPEHAGKMRAMADDWVTWGRQEKIIA